MKPMTTQQEWEVIDFMLLFYVIIFVAADPYTRGVELIRRERSFRDPTSSHPHIINPTFIHFVVQRKSRN